MKQPIKILCVDDEPFILASLLRVLSDADYECLGATSGFAGLQILAATPEVQVVISDYRMPEMTGVEFLREVSTLWPETVRGC